MGEVIRGNKLIINRSRIKRFNFASDLIELCRGWHLLKHPVEPPFAYLNRRIV